MPRSTPILLLSLATLGTGCAGFAARQPPGFAAQARPVEVDYAFFGFDGTRIADLELDGAIGVAQTTFGDDADMSTDLGILRDGQTIWAVDCTCVVETERLPPVRTVCVFRSGVPNEPTLSLVMTSNGVEPLQGVYFSPAGPMRVEGSHELVNGSSVLYSVGFTVRRGATDEPIAFVEHASMRPSMFVSQTITEAEERALRPLFIAMIQARDARFALKDRSTGRVGLSIGNLTLGVPVGRPTIQADDDAVPLPPAQRPPARPTELEVQVGQLLDGGWTDAAAALAAALPKREAPEVREVAPTTAVGTRRPEPDDDEGEPGAPRFEEPGGPRI